MIGQQQPQQNDLLGNVLGTPTARRSLAPLNGAALSSPLPSTPFGARPLGLQAALPLTTGAQAQAASLPQSDVEPLPTSAPVPPALVPAAAAEGPLATLAASTMPAPTAPPPPQPAAPHAAAASRPGEAVHGPPEGVPAPAATTLEPAASALQQSTEDLPGSIRTSTPGVDRSSRGTPRTAQRVLPGLPNIGSYRSPLPQRGTGPLAAVTAQQSPLVTQPPLAAAAPFAPLPGDPELQQSQAQQAMITRIAATAAPSSVRLADASTLPPDGMLPGSPMVSDDHLLMPRSSFAYGPGMGTPGQGHNLAARPVPTPPHASARGSTRTASRFRAAAAAIDGSSGNGIGSSHGSSSDHQGALDPTVSSLADANGAVGASSGLQDGANGSGGSHSGASSTWHDLPPGAVRLRVHLITFNMMSRDPKQLPATLFASYRGGADMYVVCSQETGPLPAWERLLLSKLGPQYSKVAQETLLSITIIVFARAEVAKQLSNIRTASVACGIGNVWGNKGGVAVSMSVAGAKLLLLTSHLAAHDEFVERRNADYHRICAQLFTPLGAASAAAAAAAAAAQEGSSPSSPSPPSVTQSLPSCISPAQTALSQSVPPKRTSESERSSPAQQLQPPPPQQQHAAPQPAHQQQQGILDGTPVGTPGGGSSAASSPINRLSALGSIARPRSMAAAAGSSAVAKANAASSNGGVLDQHDVVLWTGDLNYRINGTAQLVKHLIDTNMSEVLHANDQLRIQQLRGKAFQGFDEQPIHFPPTFKFIPNSDDYNLKRVPSWTDRILHLVNAEPTHVAVYPRYYRSVHEVGSSDHKPVVAGYELVIQQRAHGSSSAAHAGCTVS